MSIDSEPLWQVSDCCYSAFSHFFEDSPLCTECCKVCKLTVVKKSEVKKRLDSIRNKQNEKTN